jgi:pimeloyl-ACP methyl ester carboxylesterase
VRVRSPTVSRVILIHGVADRAANFSKVLPLLADLDVLAYDRRGYGDAVSLPISTGLADHVDDLLAIVGDDPVVLVAHSFGCHVATSTALRRPDLIRAVGLWEPPMPWTDIWPPEHVDRMHRFIQLPYDEMGKIWLGARWDTLPERLRQRWIAEGAGVQADLGVELAQPYRPEELAVPCVVAWGTATAEFQASGAQRYAELTGAEVIAVEGASHNGHRDAPEAFANLVRRTVELAAGR